MNNIGCISINPKYRSAPVVIYFENWIKKSFSTCTKYPKDIDLSLNDFYNIDGKIYGPVPHNKVKNILMKFKIG